MKRGSENPPSTGMVYGSGVMDDLGRGRRSANLSDHGHCLNDHGKKKYFWRAKKWKKKFIISHTGRPSSLNDFRELTSLAYFYIFITFFSVIGSSASAPSDNQGSQSFYLSRREGERRRVTVQQVPHATNRLKSIDFQPLMPIDLKFFCTCFCPLPRNYSQKKSIYSNFMNPSTWEHTWACLGLHRITAYQIGSVRKCGQH